MPAGKMTYYHNSVLLRMKGRIMLRSNLAAHVLRFELIFFPLLVLLVAYETNKRHCLLATFIS